MNIPVKKIGTLIIFIAVFVLAVLYKQGVVTAKRQKPIVSDIFIYQEKGRPVTVKTVERRDVDVVQTFTVNPNLYGSFIGYVTKDIVSSLAEGQRVVLEVGKANIEGVLTKVNREINVETGLYAVAVKTTEKFQIKERFIVCNAYTDVYHDAINVSTEHAQLEQDQYYAWVVEDGKAVRRSIQIKSQNGYGLIVESGLQAGDVLILTGQSKLHEGDKVHIVRNLDSRSAS